MKVNIKNFLRANGNLKFVLPAFLIFFIVMIIPFFIGIYYSFTDWNAISLNPSWVGFENYVRMFDDNPTFIYSIMITIIYALFNIFVINLVSFSLAILVTKNLSGKNFYRSGFFIPNLIGGLILGYIWQFIFNQAIPNMGVLWENDFLSNLFFLENVSTAILGISIAWTWQYAGYIMMIYIAAIQNIPQDLIEAASIDGANKRQKMRHITLPMVAPAFTITLFLTLINSFKQFDVKYSITGGSPFTEFAGVKIWGSRLIAMQIYETYSSAKDAALAQAMAIVFFIMLSVIAVLQVRYSKSKEIEV